VSRDRMPFDVGPAIQLDTAPGRVITGTRRSRYDVE